MPNIFSGLDPISSSSGSSLDNEELNKLKTDLTTHTNDTDIHITSAERDKWNEVDNKIEALKTSQYLKYEGVVVTCENTLASRTYDMIIKGNTYQNLNAGVIESAGEKENKIIITSNNNKLANDIDYKEYKKEISLPIEGGLKLLHNGVYDTIEQRADGVYLVQRVKKMPLYGSVSVNYPQEQNSANTVLIYLTNTHDAIPNSNNILCNAVKSLNTVKDIWNTSFDEEGVVLNYKSDALIRINKSRLDTVDYDGIKKFIADNQLTVYYALKTPIETKLDINNLDLEVYKDTTYVTTDNTIKPALSFKIPSNMGGVMQSNAQNINKLYRLTDEVDNNDNTEKYFHNTSAHEFVNILSPAVNLGNTLDCHLNTEHPTAPDTVIGWETLWNNVETTKEVMKAYKEVGFKAIRIPITWHEHMDVNGAIDTEWLARVKTIVDWAIESGLIVIINAHHDTNEGNYINAVASDYETSKAHLINIWTQVGKYFADYDNRLVFESMNECLNPNLSDKWHGDTDSFEVINKLNQVFVNTIRSQAWNRNRFLLVPTYGAGTSPEVTSAFIMPRDNVKDRLIVEVHTYNTTIGKIKSTQASVRMNLIERGFPVFLGEYGIRPSEVTDETERLNLLQLQTKMFREMGVGVCIWDNGNGSFKLLNRKTYKFYYPDIVNGIIKSSNKHDFVKLPYLDENYNLKDISNWKEGKIGFSDGEYDSSVTHYFTSDQHLIPRYSSYIVSMNDHSNDRLLVVHRDKNMKVINKVETKTNGGTITISDDDRYIDFCYYNKSTTSTLTKEEFAEYLNNGYLQINKADNATQNFEIIEQPLSEALIDLDKRIGNSSSVDLTGYATVDYVDRQIASVSTGGSTAVNAPEPEYFENLNATQVLEKISPAINLGNSLESWDENEHQSWTPIDWETSWHNVETTKEIIQAYKDKGFRTLRVPVTWFKHLDTNGNIKEEWFARVKQIVDWALECGLYVILNVHHDTNNGNYISANPDKLTDSVNHLTALWKQIGTYFESYNYRLFFEGMNECLNLELGNSAKWDGNAESYKSINTLNQAFVKTIRKQEGNKNRFLIVPTYACSAFINQCSAFKMPYDKVKNRIIVSLHNYNYKIKDILEMCNSVEKNFTVKGIPVLMGEYGITETQISDLTERTNNIKFFVKSIRELGCGTCIWESGHGDYGLLNRTNLTWNFEGYAETVIETSHKNKLIDYENIEDVDFTDINNWKYGKLSSTTGLCNHYASKYVTVSHYLKPTYNSYTVTMTDSYDRLLLFQLDKDLNLLSNETLSNGKTFTITEGCCYVGFSYHRKDSSTGDVMDLTFDNFATLLEGMTFTIEGAKITP